MALLSCACRLLIFFSVVDSLPFLSWIQTTPSSSTVCPTFKRRSASHQRLGYSKSGNEDDIDVSTSFNDDDWLQAELTLRHAHRFPSPDLDAETVALTCCRSLQWVDYPTPGAGLELCFDFFTYACRSAITARQGAKSVERFCQYGLLSPALQPFMGAHRVQVMSDNVTYTSAQPPSRGALASFPVVIHGANVLALQYSSGMNRTGVADAPPVTNMVMRLEQQRRPPNQGCWLVTEILDVRHAFAGDMGNAHVGG